MESDISIHALREEGDCFCCCHHLVVLVFQSTPSARRATRASVCNVKIFLYFNPRPPRGGRRVDTHIYHLLSCYFNPRPPRGGRRNYKQRIQDANMISIHALREEGDLSVCAKVKVFHNFNPRPPRGGRLTTGHRTATHLHFNPRPPRGGRLDRGHQLLTTINISIHALREEGDNGRPVGYENRTNFNPRPPRGGRQQKQRKNPMLLFHYTRLCTI